MLHQLGYMDIYLIDQLQKGRINAGMKILDAGCGHGRNSEYFIKNNYEIYGVDIQQEAINGLKENIKIRNSDFNVNNYQCADLKNIPFPDGFFDFIISSAVLHFSENRSHFVQLFNEMGRVLNKNGILFIRMTSKHTIEHLAKNIHDDIYLLPDGSTRYLLDRGVLNELMQLNNLEFIDPFKTVNVEDVRSMSTIVLKK